MEDRARLLQSTEDRTHEGEVPDQPNLSYLITRSKRSHPLSIRPKSPTHRGTATIANPESPAKVSTVEHLMSALAGLGIDNLLVDLTGPEIPIMDGSSAPFVFLLQSAGICGDSWRLSAAGCIRISRDHPAG